MFPLLVHLLQKKVASRRQPSDPQAPPKRNVGRMNFWSPKIRKNKKKKFGKGPAPKAGYEDEEAEEYEEWSYEDDRNSFG